MELNITHLQHYLAHGLRVQYKGIINGAELKQWENEFSDRYEINGIYPTRPCPEAIIGDKIGFIKRIEFRKNGSPSFLIGNKVGKRYYDLEGIKPLLLPLSALYEEIDGEIGIVQLIHILSGADTPDIKKSRVVKEGANYKVLYNSILDKDIWFPASLEYNYGKWSYFWNGEMFEFNQLALFDYLFSHHYDVFDLHSKGLCIYKNEI